MKNKKNNNSNDNINDNNKCRVGFQREIVRLMDRKKSSALGNSISRDYISIKIQMLVLSKIF